MKCRRPNCRRLAKNGGRNRGLCETHYNASPERGYTDGAPTRQRITNLRSTGYTMPQISEMSGISTWGLWLILDGKQLRVQRTTAAKIAAIQPNRFQGDGWIGTLGLQRRIQALMAIGWTQTEMETRSELGRGTLSHILRDRQMVRMSLARKVSAIYETLSATPGPHNRTKILARKKGWAPPLAWDDIDDPSEVPDVGVNRALKFDEKYWEMRDIGLSHKQMADRMGITGESLARQMARYGIDTTGVVA